MLQAHLADDDPDEDAEEKVEDAQQREDAVCAKAQIVVRRPHRVEVIVLRRHPQRPWKEMKGGGGGRGRGREGERERENR